MERFSDWNKQTGFQGSKEKSYFFLFFWEFSRCLFEDLKFYSIVHQEGVDNALKISCFEIQRFFFFEPLADYQKLGDNEGPEEEMVSPLSAKDEKKDEENGGHHHGDYKHLHKLSPEHREIMEAYESLVRIIFLLKTLDSWKTTKLCKFFKSW